MLGCFFGLFIFYHFLQKGFPLDINLDTLMEFFEKFGKIESIAMRRKQDKSFKGSVLVIFTNKEEGDKFVAQESVEYNSTQLIKMSKYVGTHFIFIFYFFVGGTGMGHDIYYCYTKLKYDF